MYAARVRGGPAKATPLEDRRCVFDRQMLEHNGPESRIEAPQLRIYGAIQKL